MSSELTLKEIMVTRRSIQESARRSRQQLEKVLNEMQKGIAEAMANPSPQVQAKWAEAPFCGRVPSPEEFAAWCARMARESEAASIG